MKYREKESTHPGKTQVQSNAKRTDLILTKLKPKFTFRKDQLKERGEHQVGRKELTLREFPGNIKIY